MSFSLAGLSPPILKAINEQGYKAPTDVQLNTVPRILAGRDVMLAAQTGTGKTASFVWPILERLLKGSPVEPNKVRAVILTPTRELAAQVGRQVENYAQHVPLRSAVVFGGVKINPQMMSLRQGVDVLVATPGRLLDLYHRHAVNFDQLEVFVLDEADRMLALGFLEEVNTVMALMPRDRQTLLFSATFPEAIRTLARTILTRPVEIEISPREIDAVTVEQWLCPVDKKRKAELLLHLIQETQWGQGQLLVFTNTKQGANKVTRFLEAAGVSSAVIHGDKSQSIRTRTLAAFKSGAFQVLVATDIASRGLDIPQLPHVVNFDLPKVAEDYVHRIGRTGRAGMSGEAVSLVSADEFDYLRQIEQLLQKIIDRRYVDYFEPDHNLPESRGVPAPAKTKKPKKLKKDRQSKAEEVADNHSAVNNPASLRPQVKALQLKNKTGQGKGASKKHRSATRKPNNRT